jgi:quaternary ammonium compound-resistance protein SugE
MNYFAARARTAVRVTITPLAAGRKAYVINRRDAMAWIYLLVASVMEIGWAVGLTYTDGFTRLVPSLLVGVGILASFALVARAAEQIPIGTAYCVFVGIGAFGTGVFGMLLFDEPSGFARLLSLAAIVAGVVGLKLFSESDPQDANNPLG